VLLLHVAALNRVHEVVTDSGLPDEASLALEALKGHRVRQLEEKLRAGPAWQEQDYVFCTSAGTHLHPTRDMLDLLKELLKKAGLLDIRFHDLRHSLATALLGNFTGQVVGRSVVTGLLSPVGAITEALLYYDARIQSEGLDVELMADALVPAPVVGGR